MEERAVLDQIRVAFDYCYRHDDWVHPHEDALRGLTAEQAAWKPGEHLTSIWEIVLHLAVWNENIVERTMSRENVRPAAGSWPPPAIPSDEEAWTAAKARLRESFEQVRSLLESSGLDDLAAGPYNLGDLFCRFTHAGYHLGQITKMRELKGWD